MKRVFDFGVTLGMLPVWGLVFIAVALLVRFKLGSPIFFRQVRPGLHQRPFRMIKFRSMLDLRDGDGNLLPDEQRLPRFGQFLRSTSLDELPELWNVLRGEMSLVGPRPLLMEYLPLYSPHQARRHEVSPGLTGWAQINGRNAISWQEKFDLDIWYVENRSFWLDIQIIALTLKAVIRRSDINAAGNATTERFRG